MASGRQLLRTNSVRVGVLAAERTADPKLLPSGSPQPGKEEPLLGKHPSVQFSERLRQEERKTHHPCLHRASSLGWG